MNISLPFYHHVPYLEKLLLTKHLLSLTRAGISISESLTTIADQLSSDYLKNAVSDIATSIINGSSFSQSLKKYPDIFSPFYISFIAIGEETGTLEESLDHLVEQMSKEHDLIMKLREASVYPGLIISATAVLGAVLAYVVLPQLLVFFEGFAVELPLPTKILLATATYMKQYGLLTLVAGAVLVVAGVSSTKTQLGKRIWDKLKAKSPLLGTLVIYGSMARYTRNLGILLNQSIPISRSLSVATSMVENSYIKSALMHIPATVKKGGTISSALRNKRMQAIPPLVQKMVAVGEKTGKLDESLLYVAQFYEGEIDRLAKRITTLLEPGLLLVIGLVVAFVALAIIAPIYELTGSIR